MFQFRVLGSLDLRGPGGEEILSVLAQPKRTALLAYLAVASPQGFHRRDKLAGLFWPEVDQEHARTSLRGAIHFLRRSLGEDVVLSRGDEDVGLDPEHLTCDAVRTLSTALHFFAFPPHPRAAGNLTEFTQRLRRSGPPECPALRGKRA